MTPDATSTPTPMSTAILSLAAIQTPQEIYNQATSGTPVIDDSLSTNDTNSWDEANGACLFTDGAYHVTTQPAFSGGLACNKHSAFDDLAY